MTDRPPPRLARRLGLTDAVVIGLGSMIGAGVFTAVGPAAGAAGGGLLVGLLIAAVVAFCNATSSAQLAARHPESGGTYVYGRERLGPFWGHLAGWGFVAGKVASGAAMALTFGAYAAPRAARPLALLAVVALTAVNYRGVQKTAAVTRVLVALVLVALAVVVTGVLGGGEADLDRVGPLLDRGWRGVLQSAGFLFFAFAGYARIATLGGEVVEPERTIPRAIPIALGITLAVYALVTLAALAAVGPRVLAGSDAPLAEAVRAGSLDELVPAVRIGGTIAALGVLLSLVAGVSRTAFAMAERRDLPSWLHAVHPRFRTPHRAEVAVGVVVGAVVLAADVRQVIGFSSFTVLVYYGIANAAALRLRADERRWPRGLAVLGVAGCGLLAVTLPASSVLVGAAVLAIGAVLRVSRPGGPARG